MQFDFNKSNKMEVVISLAIILISWILVRVRPINIRDENLLNTNRVSQKVVTLRCIFTGNGKETNWSPEAPRNVPVSGAIFYEH